MQELLVFILSVSGLSWILTKGSVFMPLRVRVTFKSEAYILLVKDPNTNTVKNNFYRQIYWFLNSILNCHGCMALWSGLLCYGLHWIGLDVVVYGFAGVSASLLVISLIKFLDKR